MATDLPPRMLTREQAKEEQRQAAIRMTVAERLAAMTALNERMYAMRGINPNELQADLTPRFVSRRKG